MLKRLMNSIAKNIAACLSFLAIFALPLFFYPSENSAWVSSSDVHALLEFSATLVALTAGVMVLLYFFTTGNRLFLVISCGLIFVGAEQLVHGVFSFDRVWTVTPQAFKAAIPITWLSGHFVLAGAFLFALLFREQETAPEKRMASAVVYNFFVFVMGLCVTALLFYTPFLPDIVRPGSYAKKIVDFCTALLYFAAFISYSWLYFTSRRIIFWGLAAFLASRVVVHVFTFNAQAFYDAYWDLGHLTVLLSYFLPIFSIWGETFRLHKASMEQVAELEKTMAARQRAEESLQRYSERLLNLHRIDTAILQAIETPETTAKAVLLSLRVLLGCQCAGIGIFESGNRTVKVFMTEVNGATVVQTEKNLAESVYGDVEYLGQDVIEVLEDISGVATLSPMARALQAEGMAASLCVPLISRRGLLGALNIGWESPRSITSEEKETVAEVATQLTIALEQARLLEEAERHASELEQRVAERTAQLVAVNKELETFSYSVSHDLKAPLRGISGYSHLLEIDYADRLDDEGRLFIRNILSSAAQMHQLIDDLLSYSRLERRPPQNASLDLSTLVQAVVSERSADVEQSGVQVYLEVPHLFVQADRDGLAVVLRNLLENALKFSSNSSQPTVDIGARPADDRIILWIRDNGIGFDMKFHDRIFEIFQRLQRAEDYPGTGIGLALVRKAMQRMGGRVWAESAPGAGATFYLEIPT